MHILLDENCICKVFAHSNMYVKILYYSPTDDFENWLIKLHHHLIWELYLYIQKKYIKNMVLFLNRWIWELANQTSPSSHRAVQTHLMIPTADDTVDEKSFFMTKITIFEFMRWRVEFICFVISIQSVDAVQNSDPSSLQCKFKYSTSNMIPCWQGKQQQSWKICRC